MVEWAKSRPVSECESGLKGRELLDFLTTGDYHQSNDFGRIFDVPNATFDPFEGLKPVACRMKYYGEIKSGVWAWSEWMLSQIPAMIATKSTPTLIIEPLYAIRKGEA